MLLLRVEMEFVVIKNVLLVWINIGKGKFGDRKRKRNLVYEFV